MLPSRKVKKKVVPQQERSELFNFVAGFNIFLSNHRRIEFQINMAENQTKMGVEFLTHSGLFVQVINTPNTITDSLSDEVQQLCFTIHMLKFDCPAVYLPLHLVLWQDEGIRKLFGWNKEYRLHGDDIAHMRAQML